MFRNLAQPLRLALVLAPFALSALLVLQNPIESLVNREFNNAADFDVFYQGANLFEQERYEELYDVDQFASVIGRTDTNLWYAYPPFYSRAWALLNNLSIDAAWMAWTIVSILVIGALAASATRPRLAGIVLALTSFPAAMNLQLGQNGAFAAALLAAAFFLAKRGMLVGAGVALGLLIFKPQLAIGMGVWWLVDRRYRRSAYVALATAISIVGLSWIFDAPAWSQYLSAIGELGELPSQTLQMSLAGFFDLLIPGWSLARNVGVVAGVALIVIFGRWAASPRDPEVVFAMAAVVTVLASPYVLMYDYLILVVPAALLSRFVHFDDLWREAAVLSWAMLLSALLVERMTENLGFGVQVAPIALSLLAWAALRRVASVAPALPAS